MLVGGVAQSSKCDPSYILIQSFHDIMLYLFTTAQQFGSLEGTC